MSRADVKLRISIAPASFAPRASITSAVSFVSAISARPTTDSGIST
jgi:hypothetical protein